MSVETQRRGLADNDPRHGTLNGYSNLGCRCDSCRVAHTRYCAEAKLRRFARGCPEHLHGTPGGYGNYGCRCRDCTTAWTDEHRARRQRRQREDAR